MTTEYPRDDCLGALFEEQAGRTPDAVAVVFENCRLTYRELNDRSNRVAHHLRRLGVGRDLLVGVCLERSLDLIVGLLGVVKAGGAYLPLDPEYPGQRLEWMVRDGGLKWILTRQSEGGTVAGLGAELVLIDDLESFSKDTGNPEPVNQATDLAYVMYTSGSTGEPKGVSVVHRGVVRLVKGPNYASFETDDVFLQLAPAGFDASTLEIWGCLLNGGRLVVMKPGQPTLRELGEAIRAAGVTTLWLTASLFHLMVEEELESLAGVRQLLAGGDVLFPTHVRMVLRKCPGVTVINGYGPTENTTFTCCHPMKSVEDLGEGAVPIGQPISNTSVYLLDGEANRCRPGLSANSMPAVTGWPGATGTGRP